MINNLRVPSHEFKVVFAEEMVRIETLSLKRDASEGAFIANAGKAVALIAEEILTRAKSRMILLLVGKGNKGADACAAGIELLKMGYSITVVSLCPLSECSHWNQQFFGNLLNQGAIHVNLEEGLKKRPALIIDGLLGTGCKGQLSDPFLRAIQAVNQSNRKVLSIDIPSGVHPTTGKVFEEAIRAHHTVTLGMAKSGLFLKEGWKHTGILHLADFGLSLKFIRQAHALARMLDASDLILPSIIRTQHKYEAGYVLAIAGSTLFPGAAKLAGLAALRSGAGIVRIFHQGKIGELPFELIAQPWHERAFAEESKRAGSILIGPGFKSGMIRQIIKKMKLPLVVDGEGLQKNIRFPENAILTPHRGEMLRLLGQKESFSEDELLSESRIFADTKKVILILKGSPTWIFIPGEKPVISTFGDPGMATAGSGDVLSGVLAALLARKMPPAKAALFGVYLHGLAGEFAAQEKGSYSMIASDIINALSEVFSFVCNN